jgi:hypothetical protein
MKLNLKKEIPKSPAEIILAAILVLYILGEFKTPHAIVHFVSTPVGVFIVVATIALMIQHGNTLLTVLYLISIYELYRRCAKHHSKKSNPSHKHPSHKDHTVNLSRPVKIRGTEEKLPKDKRNPKLNAYKQFPSTLEEQVVKKMAPWVMHKSTTPPSYLPVMEGTLEGSTL